MALHKNFDCYWGALDLRGTVGFFESKWKGVSAMNDKENMIPYYSFPWRVCSDVDEAEAEEEILHLIVQKIATKYRARPHSGDEDKPPMTPPLQRYAT